MMEEGGVGEDLPMATQDACLLQHWAKKTWKGSAGISVAAQEMSPF